MGKIAIMDALDRIRIIIVEPAGPLNVGSVARVMKNMGLSQLVIVNPQCDIIGQEARQMAVHGGDILAQAQVVSTIPEALTGCYRSIATTGRQRNLPITLETPEKVLPWLLENPLESALIFGREDSGLTNQELNYAQRFLGIPANPEYSSLNLAQSVAVCAYELYKIALSHSEPDPASAPAFLPTSSHPAPLEQLEAYYNHLETVLLEIGYLYPHTAQARMEKFRQIFNRTNLNTNELALLRGILRQIQWAQKNL